MGILSDLFGSEKIRAERATVTFGNSVFSVDGYRLLDTGEFRAGLSGVSELVGYDRKWLSEVGRKQTNTLKILQSMGYTGRMIEVQVSNDRSGTRALTISLDDLRYVIRYAASHAKPPKQKAIQLADGLMGVSIREYFDATFIKDVKRLNRMNTEFERVLIAEENRRRELHQMPIEDAMNAPHDPGWQGSNPDNESRVYRNPWD